MERELLDGGMPYIDNSIIKYHSNHGISGNPGSNIPIRIINDISFNSGRGIVISYAGTVPSANLNIIDNNTISYNSEGAIDTYPATISNNTINNNTSDYEGSITCAGCTITDNVIRDNTNTGQSGGGIRLHGGIVTGNIIYNNIAENGGGVFIRSGTVNLSNNLIINNTAQKGGGVYIDEQPSLTMHKMYR